MNPTRNRNLVVRSPQKLVRHMSRISLLSLSKDSSFLLSAAGDKVVMWDLKDGMHIAINPSNGPISALAWVPTVSDASAAFAFGCQDGLIHLYCQIGNKPLFFPLASVHLEDGPVEHLVYNSIFRCLVAVAVGIGHAHMWRVDEEGQLTSFPLPDEEPAFPDGLLKHVFKREIAHHYSNGDHIHIKPSNDLGVIDLN